MYVVVFLQRSLCGRLAAKDTVLEE